MRMRDGERSIANNGGIYTLFTLYHSAVWCYYFLDNSPLGERVICSNFPPLQFSILQLISAASELVEAFFSRLYWSTKVQIIWQKGLAEALKCRQELCTDSGRGSDTVSSPLATGLFSLARVICCLRDAGVLILRPVELTTYADRKSAWAS